MVDKTTFMETLRSVQQIAQASPEAMTKEEIRSYFQDMDLSEEQQEMIYQFLLTPQDAAAEGDAGQAGEEESIASPEPKALPKAGKQTRNPHFQMYVRELSAIPALTAEQQNLLYQRLLSGDQSVTEEISHQWLKKIICIAEGYATPRAYLEDLVQEGNISLLLGLGQLLGKASDYEADGAGSLGKEQQKRLEEYLEAYIRGGMESYRGGVEGEADSENAILAKVSLIHEARKALTEENGTDPTIQELCEYTRISPQEIVDILDLHEKARKG